MYVVTINFLNVWTPSTLEKENTVQNTFSEMFVYKHLFSKFSLFCCFYVFAAEVDPSIASTVEEKETAVESGDPSLPIAIERAVEQGIGKKHFQKSR